MVSRLEKKATGGQPLWGTSKALNTSPHKFHTQLLHIFPLWFSPAPELCLSTPGGGAVLGLENRGWLARPVHPPRGGGAGWAGLGCEGKSHGTKKNPLQKFSLAFGQGGGWTSFWYTPPAKYYF